MKAYYIILQRCLAKGIPLAQSKAYAYHQSIGRKKPKPKLLDPVKCNKACDTTCHRCPIYPEMKRRQR